MMKAKRQTALVAVLAALALTFFALSAVKSVDVGAENVLKTLGTYDNVVIPENNFCNEEYNVFDQNKKTDYGIRVPTFDADGNFTSYLSGTDLGNPGANGMNIGNATPADYGVTKVRMVYAGGAARFRYGYDVDLSAANINLRFLDFGGYNGQLCLTFSNDHMAFCHPQVAFNGVVLIIYKDTATQMQSALISAKYNGSIDGLTSTNGNLAIMSYPISDDDATTLAFSIYTWKNEDGSYSIQVMNKNASIVYTLPVALSSELVIADENASKGLTDIGINCRCAGSETDSLNAFLTYEIEVKDSTRLAYEASVLNPVKASLAEYMAIAIETAVTDMAGVDAWLAKRDAIDMNLAAKLRIGDKYYMQLGGNIMAANAKLKQLAGGVVNNYIADKINDLNTAFEKAESNDYTEIVTAEELTALKKTYQTIDGALNTTYGSVLDCTTEELNNYDGALAAAKSALDRLELHLAIYAVENADMSNAEALVTVKAEYAKINTDETKAAIAALDTDEEIKTALLGRLSAIETTIATAESALDAAEIIDGQIKNYEDASIETIEEMRDALTVKALIGDYSELDGAEAFAARIKAKDDAILDAAWLIVKVDVEALEALADNGTLSTYRSAAAISEAISKISNTDIISSENKTATDELIAAANKLVSDFSAKMAEEGWILTNYNGASVSKYDDIQFTEDGVRYVNHSDSIALYTKALSLSDGVEVVFTAEQWGYLMGDGKANGGNNAWICFADRYTADGGYHSRNENYSVSVMYWQCNGPSYAKGYYMSDEAVSTTETTAIPDNATVVVTFKANDASSRFEIETIVYNADGTEKLSCYSILLLPYSDTMNPEVFSDGVYVSFSCYMDTRPEFHNDFLIKSLGKEGDWAKSQEKPVDSTTDSGDNDSVDQSATASDTSSEEKTGSCSSEMKGSAVVFVFILAAAAVIAAKRRKIA